MTVKIPYKDMVEYYNNILRNIYREIQEDTPIAYGDGFCEVIYPKEYHEAYGWLQKADWRLSDTVELSEYYNEDTFKYFGIHNLSNVQHRIVSYLEETQFPYTSNVTDCHKYDEYTDLNKELVKDYDTFQRWFDYYKRLQYRKSSQKSFDVKIQELKQDIEILKESLDNTFLTKYITNTTELLDTVTEMEKLLDKFEPYYMEIKP